MVNRDHLTYSSFFFFFNDTAPTEIYTLSLHDALPIPAPGLPARRARGRRRGRPGLPGAVPHRRRPGRSHPADARPHRRRHGGVRSTTMNKLINDPADVVTEALLGFAAAHPELRVDHQHQIVYRGDAPRPGKVGVISGGGSGHEPLHVGFVGPGMLDAACPGEVFTSPVPDQILEATKRVDGGAGVLHVVKNYTGDVMNFEMAAELAAAETGVQVVSVVTDDDVAVQDSLHTAGRRGVGVTVLLEKIAGAAAEQGRPLTGVAEIAQRVNAHGRSMGMALTSSIVPAVGT